MLDNTIKLNPKIHKKSTIIKHKEKEKEMQNYGSY